MQTRLETKGVVRGEGGGHEMVTGGKRTGTGQVFVGRRGKERGGGWLGRGGKWR